MSFTCNELRGKFIDFFNEKGHEVIASSSLVPQDDPTLLFTNAGMVQFKNVFLGLQKVPYVCATSSQRCVRAGGKHNDLEQVGYTKRHHTFFEMLGNFSFGEYFKREAILYAWTFLTEVLAIPKERLWISVYYDDKETEDIWINEMHVDPARLSRCGDVDNFWSMGEVGPCGPCTEIFYDHGADIPGGPPGSENQDADRYVEIWNLVFMQYNRDMQGDLTPLPKPCVDTGMGLERIAAVMQGVHDNYEIDIFKFLLDFVGKAVSCDDHANTSLRVIADHIRSTAFLIIDGVTPSNEGRGYVLRRIIRRALRHGFKLGETQPFFHKLTEAVVSCMGEAYPELVKQQVFIEQVIHEEEDQFSNTLKKGLKIFDEQLKKLNFGSVVSGDTVFLLYDTYGFPPDLTADMAKEQGLSIDEEGFLRAMSQQKEMSSRAGQFQMDAAFKVNLDGETQFTGYDALTDEAHIINILIDGVQAHQIDKTCDAMIVLDRTPFYAESGGQVGDSGVISSPQGKFVVTDTRKQGEVHLHMGHFQEGVLACGDLVCAQVDSTRHDIVLNHSATHLLHQALRDVLGEHVVQKGSLVDAKRLRFDFSHTHSLTDDEIRAVEDLVNQKIRNNLPTIVELSSLDEAKQQGVLALFGEKYKDEVRVVQMGNYSAELCGGTHVERTGDIGLFIITSETACASGIRRIEAITGEQALKWMQARNDKLKEISKILKVKEESLTDRLTTVLSHYKDQTKQLNKMKQQLMQQDKDDFIQQAEMIEGVNILAAQLPEIDNAAMRQLLDQLKDKLNPAAIILATVDQDKVKLIAGVSKSCMDKVSANDLLKHVAMQLDGKGGGRADFAQGGGHRPADLPAALDSVKDWARQQLSE